MTTEVYIEGQKLDVTEDVKALFTYSVDDVTDFASRETSFSRTIIFPGSSTNNRLFGSAFEFTAYNDYDPAQPNIGYNFNAAKTGKCFVVIGGVQVFKGVLRLLEITSMNGAIQYQTAFFGELGGLFSAIGNKLVTGNADATDDLDFSAYNQNWTTANIIASWGGAGAGLGVMYPVIDYGLTTTNRISFSFQAMRPALYVLEYIDKIFQKAGYTWDSTFFNSAFFKRLVIPHSRDKVFTRTNILLDNRELGVTDIIYDNSTGTQLSSKLQVPTSVVLLNFTAAYSVYPTGTTFTYTGPTGFMNFGINVKGGAEGGEGRVIVKARLLKNGVSQFERQMTLTGTASGTGYTSPVQYFDLPINVGGIQLTSGDTIAIDLTASYPGTAPSFDWHVFLTTETRMTVTAQTYQSVPAVYGDPLNMNDMLPVSIKQADLFMSIVKMFNLRVVEDTVLEKHVTVSTFAESFDNTDPLLWSDKVDRSNLISLKPMAEVNARYFNFLYDTDSDYDNDRYKQRYGAGYGDRTIDVGLDFVKDKKECKVIFSSSPLVGGAGLDKAVTRICKINNGVEERMASKIRILQVKYISPVTTWNILQDDLTTVITSTTGYGYAGHVNDPGLPQGADLNFGSPAEIYWVPANPYLATNVVNEFYTPYLNEITDKDSKLLTCFVRLSPLDIANIDWNKSIMIDGQLWRLNKIEDYNAVEDDTTKVQLLKVINLSY